ncbi:hypothetical protein GGP75_002173 [Salinibacter ruber]|nr:hypothetical protein [Salinibacter ruber]
MPGREANFREYVTQFRRFAGLSFEGVYALQKSGFP